MGQTCTPGCSEQGNSHWASAWPELTLPPLSFLLKLIILGLCHFCTHEQEKVCQVVSTTDMGYVRDDGEGYPTPTPSIIKYQQCRKYTDTQGLAWWNRVYRKHTALLLPQSKPALRSGILGNGTVAMLGEMDGKRKAKAAQGPT